MSIVQALIDQVTAEVEQSQHRGRVLAVDIVVGRMSGVHVDSIRFAFELLSPGTLVAGADLRIREPKAIVACRDCRARHDIEQIRVDCPDCGSGNVVIQGGQDLWLQSIELADEFDGTSQGPTPNRRA
jgi:hydrogenase nickel incorporation protein HypA/HybF